MPFWLLILFVVWTGTAYGAADLDYAAWAREDPTGRWTRTAEKAVRQSRLPDILPNGIEDFCPAYAEKDRETRVKFWVGLLSAMARAESDCRTEVRHTEAIRDGRGRRVISRGLLQISVESANQGRYDCRIGRVEELHDPVVNLRCAVKILEYWIRQDQTITSFAEASPQGGGRYWATLRPPHPRLPEIAAFTRNLKACQGLPHPAP